MFVTATTIYKWKCCEAAQGNTEIMPCSCMGKSQDQVWGFFLTDLPGWWWWWCFYCTFALERNQSWSCCRTESKATWAVFGSRALNGCLIDIQCHQVIFPDWFCTWFMPRYMQSQMLCFTATGWSAHVSIITTGFMLACMWFCCGISTAGTDPDKPSLRAANVKRWYKWEDLMSPY